jgi:hypothetical protein
MLLVERKLLDSNSEATARFIMLVTVATLALMGISINIAIARLRKKLHKSFPGLTKPETSDADANEDHNLIAALRPLVLECIRLSGENKKVEAETIAEGKRRLSIAQALAPNMLPAMPTQLVLFVTLVPLPSSLVRRLLPLFVVENTVDVNPFPSFYKPIDSNLGRPAPSGPSG